MHTVKASDSRSSKATPKHRPTSTMFDCRDRVFFFEGLILFSEHRADVTCQKASVLSHLSKEHSPRSPVACQYAFWQIPVSLFYDLLSTVESSSFHSGSNSDGECDLTLMYVDLEGRL